MCDHPYKAYLHYDTGCNYLNNKINKINIQILANYYNKSTFNETYNYQLLSLIDNITNSDYYIKCKCDIIVTNHDTIVYNYLDETITIITIIVFGIFLLGILYLSFTNCYKKMYGYTTV